MKIPDETECIALLEEVGVADAVLGHSMRVHSVAMQVCDSLDKKGVQVDRSLVTAAALLHDVLKLKAGKTHPEEGGEFLRQKGMSRVASVVEKHGLNSVGHPERHPTTTEEKILFYSDLRVLPGKVGTVDERFEYIKGKYTISEEMLSRAFDFAKQLEREFFD